MKRMFCLIASSLVLSLVTPAAAEMFGPDAKSCGEQPNTLAIVDCSAAKTKSWDQRLNAAYKTLSQRVDPGQRDPLKAAQRLWIQYRDANCRFYGSGEGSISQVQAAECVRSMTQDRALELEEASKP